MKRTYIKITVFFAAVSLFAASCTKKIDEAYLSPNADARVPVEQILPPLISCMAANSAGHGPLNDYRFFGKYIQYWQFCNAGDMYDRMSSRLVQLGSTQADMTASIFRVHYYDIGQNCVNMMKWAEEEKKWDYVGIGKAISAWSWLTLTDVQGECILKEAFDQSRLVFDYDSQEDVYAFVKQQCYDALGYLNKSGDGMNPANLAVSDAYMYGGDLNKWKKFVYGILARVHNHVSNKSIYKPDSVIYYTDPARSLSTNADNAMVKFAYTTGGVSGSANFYGPLRNNLSSVTDGTNSAIRQSAYIANLLSGVNSAFPGVTDPRAIYLIRKNANGTFKGLQPNKGNSGITVANDRPENFWGVSQTTGVNNTAPGNDANCRYIFRNNAPVPVMTASEIQFMRAEAFYRMGQKGAALTAYQAGISLNIDMLVNDFNTNVPTAEQITPAMKTTFLSNTTVVPASATSLTLNKIMLQKYIALYGWGVGETWVDMRRFHYTDTESGIQVYTDFVLPSGTDLYPNNNGKPVYRTYPRYNSETVWNIESLKSIGADKDDYHTLECWFSKP
jgi:hypothetical protein